MKKSQIKLGGGILFIVLILILITTVPAWSQSFRLMNPKIDLYGNMVDIPSQYEDSEPIRLFETKNEKVLLNQMVKLYNADFYNQIINDPELYCLAQTSYWESRGESFHDKIAVANVVVNRVKDTRFPKSICKVVRDGCQFSWYCSGLNQVHIRVTEHNIHDAKVFSWIESIIAAIVVKNHIISDITRGATHFYAHKLVRPNWAATKYITIKSSGHTFVRLPCDKC